MSDELNLVLDMGALEEIEQATGGNALSDELWTSISASKIVSIVAAGLRHTGADLEARRAQARALPLHKLQATVSTITTAVQAALPDADQLAEAESAG